MQGEEPLAEQGRDGGGCPCEVHVRTHRLEECLAGSPTTHLARETRSNRRVVGVAQRSVLRKQQLPAAQDVAVVLEEHGQILVQLAPLVEDRVGTGRGTG
jgi:hypothetical protein